MACFVVPVVEAVVVSAVYAAVRVKENKYTLAHADNSERFETENKRMFSKKLAWLMKLLFGGSFLLAFEHLWHGEIVPWAPFLTAAADPGDRAQMLHEMSTVGIMMAVSVTALWAAMVIISYFVERRNVEAVQKIEEA